MSHKGKTMSHCVGKSMRMRLGNRDIFPIPTFDRMATLHWISNRESTRVHANGMRLFEVFGFACIGSFAVFPKTRCVVS